MQIWEKFENPEAESPINLTIWSRIINGMNFFKVEYRLPGVSVADTDKFNENLENNNIEKVDMIGLND